MMIRIGVKCDRRNVHRVQRTQNTGGDCAPIGDQDFIEFHRDDPESGPALE
jgi:hypothetical protein